ncbi:hypothetical protein SNEBB_009085 [Seison nebaliae]|nr:hypothetical protein SNEBB_009085 [Seison nebaliae]
MNNQSTVVNDANEPETDKEMINEINDNENNMSNNHLVVETNDKVDDVVNENMVSDTVDTNDNMEDGYVDKSSSLQLDNVIDLGVHGDDGNSLSRNDPTDEKNGNEDLLIGNHEHGENFEQEQIDVELTEATGQSDLEKTEVTGGKGETIELGQSTDNNFGMENDIGNDDKRTNGDELNVTLNQSFNGNGEDGSNKLELLENEDEKMLHQDKTATENKSGEHGTKLELETKSESKKFELFLNNFNISEDKLNNCLWIANLNDQSFPSEVKCLTSKYGKVKTVRIVVKKQGEKRRFYSLVELSNEDDEAQDVKQFQTQLDRKTCTGTQIYTSLLQSGKLPDGLNSLKSEELTNLIQFNNDDDMKKWVSSQPIISAESKTAKEITALHREINELRRQLNRYRQGEESLRAKERRMTGELRNLDRTNRDLKMDLHRLRNDRRLERNRFDREKEELLREKKDNATKIKDNEYEKKVLMDAAKDELKKRNEYMEIILSLENRLTELDDRRNHRTEQPKMNQTNYHNRTTNNSSSSSYVSHHPLPHNVDNVSNRLGGDQRNPSDYLPNSHNSTVQLSSTAYKRGYQSERHTQNDKRSRHDHIRESGVNPRQSYNSSSHGSNHRSANSSSNNMNSNNNNNNNNNTMMNNNSYQSHSRHNYELMGGGHLQANYPPPVSTNNQYSSRNNSSYRNDNENNEYWRNSSCANNNSTNSNVNANTNYQPNNTSASSCIHRKTPSRRF